MLTQTTRRIRCAADVEGLSVLGAEEVTAVEGWHGPAFDLKRVGHDRIYNKDEVEDVVDRIQKRASTS